MAAFERSDASLLPRVLRADATLDATPFGDWQAGRLRCIRMLESYLLSAPGDWRMISTSANCQSAAVGYRRDPSGAFRATEVMNASRSAGRIRIELTIRT